MSILSFTKMQGLGNDFVVIDAFSQKINLSHEQIRKLANRNLGIGADQILFIEKPLGQNADFRYRIFNADGNEVEHCGNGARCFARYVREKKLINKDKILVEVNNTITTMLCNPDKSVTIEMGIPNFDPISLPFITTNLSHRLEQNSVIWQINTILTKNKINESSPQDSEQLPNFIEFSIVSTGNPHAVIFVKSIEIAPVVKIAKFLEQSGHFPNGINVGFLEVVDRHAIKLRVHERGVGETLACGTGACAAAISAIQRGVLDSPVRISMNGGNLLVTWGKNSPILMTGPAKIVFNGTIDLNTLSDQ